MTDLDAQVPQEIDLLLKEDEGAFDLFGGLRHNGSLEAAVPFLAEYAEPHPDVKIRPALRVAHDDAVPFLSLDAALRWWVSAVAAGGGTEVLFEWLAGQIARRALSELATRP